MSRVELLAIGNELLLGATVDTNSAWIATRLAREGIAVARKTTVGDDDAAIRDALDAALRRTGIVICTGGLGPTLDDLTRDAVAAHYGRAQHTDQGWVDELQRRYDLRGIPMPQVNRVQALLPEGATLLFNARGTAPGIAIDDASLGLTVLLPGVPNEMRGLMDEHVVPMLRARLGDTGAVTTRTLRTTGISEAALAERVDDVARDVAPLTLAFLPGTNGVDLRVTHVGAGDAAPHFERVIGALRERLAEYVYADDDTDLAVVVGRMLTARGLTLALAESCTGGLASKRMTDAAGSSSYMNAGFVTYANEAKQDHLGVRLETLALHGAVSEQCAREMALGARSAGRADVAVSITGVAGPGGGSEGKPVGTVWFALAMRDEVARAHGHDDVVLTRRVVI
ncbi:MAG TPA: competence/damage-inducible protein A, partial [Longimicrobiales bacterium]|nr:competence/damage-inducible protein A [Longimicrobiales bacterium]